MVYETIALPLSYSGGRAQFVQEPGQPRKGTQLSLGMREAIRFAARSEPLEELNSSERAALDGFVSVLSEQK